MHAATVLGLAGWIAGGAPNALAGEGMWLPTQSKDLAPKLTEAGIQIPASTLGDPKAAPLGAVVGLGFCTASFVSADGLLVTNAHCAEDFVNNNASAEHDYVEDGYTAPSRKDELPAGPSARLYLVEAISDVTAPIRAIATDAKVPDAQRLAAVERAESELVARCERQAGRSCEVVSQFGGATYQLVQRLELRDVRVVYSPAYHVAYFGGDLDNFEWPRHDGDFAFLRAYVGPNGKPADPSPKNVPYHPAHWLKIAPNGVAAGASVLVAGYPGGTDRFASVAELKFQRDVVFPRQLASTLQAEVLVADAMKADPEAQNRLQGTADNLANTRKYLKGMLDNVAATTLIADKEAFEARVAAWAAEDASRATVTSAASEIARMVGEQAETFPTANAVGGLANASFVAVAFTAYRWAEEQEKKKDADREPGFQKRDRPNLEAWFTGLDPQLWLPYEKALLAARLADYAALPEARHVAELDAWLTAHGGADKAVETLFTEPSMAAAAYRTGLLGLSKSAFEASTDPWLGLAVAMERGFMRQAREAGRARNGARLRYEPIVTGAMRDLLGTAAYPDANNTLRITFGRVTGYAPRDGLVATPKTTLAGLVCKDLGPDYDAPDALIAAAAKVHAAPTAGGTGSDPGRKYFDPELGDIPVNFLSDVDTTGGNSGSPTLDANGDLVGLVFDGNYESMAADWQYDARTTRSIHVDIRYILWLLSLDPNASWITAELTPRS